MRQPYFNWDMNAATTQREAHAWTTPHNIKKCSWQNPGHKNVASLHILTKVCRHAKVCLLGPTNSSTKVLAQARLECINASYVEFTMISLDPLAHAPQPASNKPRTTS